MLVISFSYAVDFEAGGNAQRKHFYWIDGGARGVLAPRKKILTIKNTLNYTRHYSLKDERTQMRTKARWTEKNKSLHLPTS